MNEKYDLGIIGSGPAGFTAAISAAESGEKVVLFEKDLIGGVCLNRGCIPTKALLQSAEIYEKLKSCNNFGIHCENLSVNFSEINNRKNQIVQNLRNNLERNMKNLKIEIIKAEAKLVDNKTIQANDTLYKCDEIIIATGSKPKTLPNLDYDHKFILTSDDVLNFNKLPQSMIIVGSGAIGIEFSRIFSAFGVKIILVEFADYLLPCADTEISKRIERLFKSKNIEFYTKTSVEKISTANEHVTVSLSNEKTIEASCILLAIGRSAIPVNQIEGVKYIGDTLNSIQLAHFASKQALETVCQIPFDENLTPSVVYGSPEIAWIGKREQDLINQEYKKSTIPISALAKSQCDGSIDGMIKILVQDDQIVGAHIISQEASSLIQEISIIMHAKYSTKKIKEICFAHPTYSEGILDCVMRLK